MYSICADVRCTKLLLEAGANVNINYGNQYNDCNSLMTCVLHYSNSNLSATKLKLILEANCTPEIINTVNNEGMTPLRIVSSIHYKNKYRQNTYNGSFIKLLVNARADINHLKHGYTILDETINSNDHEKKLWKFLIDNGAKLNSIKFHNIKNEIIKEYFMEYCRNNNTSTHIEKEDNEKVSLVKEDIIEKDNDLTEVSSSSSLNCGTSPLANTRTYSYKDYLLNLFGNDTYKND